MEQPKLIDNIATRLVDDLKTQIKPNSNIAFAAASFSIYAFEALKKELEQIDELRFVFTQPTFIDNDTDKKQQREFYIPKLDRERTLYGSDFEIKLRNQLTQKAIAKECADWVRQKVKFKSIAPNQQMDTFLHVQNDNSTVYTPLNHFTTSKLGLEKDNSCFTIINKLSTPIANEYLRNFNEQWNNNGNFIDVTERVLERIESVYKENSPEFIYFITLYNIFKDFLQNVSEDNLPNSATGFKSSAIWNKLYKFQKDAALAIISKLETYNGCILADSVGLGKTFTALSVIKYYENRNKTVLVLCPKKLNENWITYKSNYKNNPIADDRLRYDVLFHTDLSREGGESNGLDLNRINWGNYDLVVIDESHNFRNGGKISTDEEDENPRQNRYLRLMNKIIRQGVKTKVLMLSATPVNNGFRDLKNQIALAYEGKPELMDKLLNTEQSIESIFRQAQTEYNNWTKLPEEQRTIENLTKRLSFDFFEVLDSVTIARSRRHIEQFYGTEEIGSFPKRLTPITRRPCLTDLGQNRTVTYNEIYGQLLELNLSFYTPSAFILASSMHKYADAERNLSRKGRESGLRRIMAINILKRLESSVFSFRLSLKRIQESMENTIEKIDNFKIGHSIEVDDYDIENLTDEADDLFVGGKKSKIDLADMNRQGWRNDIALDIEKIKLLLILTDGITAEHDTKLQQLKADLKHKIEHPINGNNKKVIVFTAFADTAEYLYNNLATPLLQKFGLHSALVTGTERPKSTLTAAKNDFNTVLTLFSPISKDRQILLPDSTDEIDILFATDCISEGQNLQDCDYLVNYDIHWNPVRIIQRFGRIDRIGSLNKQIQLVNYWPDIELDDYINLKGRVESRMKATILASTGDDNLLSADEKGDLNYRREQLKRLQQEVVDLEEMGTGINIMDLGLNEFRLDLLEYMHDNIDVANAPFGLSAVVAQNEMLKPGVMFVLQNKNKEMSAKSQNLLHPYYLLYIDNEGNTICNHLKPKDTLNLMRAACKGKKTHNKELCKLHNKQTKDGQRMTHYSDLLKKAIESIIGVNSNNEMARLLNGETELFRNNIRGLDDFELICFLVVK